MRRWERTELPTEFIKVQYQMACGFSMRVITQPASVPNTCGLERIRTICKTNLRREGMFGLRKSFVQLGTLTMSATHITEMGQGGVGNVLLLK
jgi:hypothetical protein